MAESCGTCKFWKIADASNLDNGECRAKLPELLITPAPNGVTVRGVFVPVVRHSWCGYWKGKDEKTN